MHSGMDDDPVRTLKQGQLHIHCFQMELTQNTSAQPRKYAGSGYITQNTDGGIAFVIYAITSSNTNGYSEISSILHGRPGTVIPKLDYYTLTACTYLGYTWTAPRIVNPSVHWHESVPRVSGEIHTLHRSKREVVSDQPYRMRMTFFENIDFPCPLMSSQFVGADFIVLEDKRFRIQKKLDNETVVEITSKTPFPMYFDIRVIEALQFVLARAMSWRAFFITDNNQEILQLAAQPRQSAGVSLYPPLMANQVDQFDCSGAYLVST